MREEKISTKDVLKTIAAAGGLLILSAAIPNLPIALGIMIKAWRNFKKKDIGRIIKRLEKQEMISVKEKGDKISLEITEKGRKRLLEYDFENIKLKAKRRDGKWRLIIFDIPERKKQNRDAFRKKLLQLDCIRLQDSVFVSAFPCKNEIDFLTHYLEISDYVTVLTIDKIERGEELIFKKYYQEDEI